MSEPPLHSHRRPRLRPTPAARAELQLLHRYLDSWRGIGDIVVGMHRAGWDVQMTEYGSGYWRATFWLTGVAHSISGESAYEATAWGAVQRAAWATIGKTT